MRKVILTMILGGGVALFSNGSHAQSIVNVAGFEGCFFHYDVYTIKCTECSNNPEPNPVVAYGCRSVTGDWDVCAQCYSIWGSAGDPNFWKIEVNTDTGPLTFFVDWFTETMMGNERVLNYHQVPDRGW